MRSLCFGTRRVWACVSLAAAAFALGGCPEVPQAPDTQMNSSSGKTPGDIRLIVLSNGDSQFWNAVKAGAEDAEKELGLSSSNLRVVIDRNNFDVQGQLDKLKQYSTATDIAGVAISVTDANSRAIIDELRELQQSGVDVITIDSDVDRDSARDVRFAYLGTDNVQAGREMGRAMRGLLPDGGTFATFVGLKGAANARDRGAGLVEGAGSGLKRVERLGDGGDANVARSNVRDALDRNPKLSALVGIWSYNGPAIVDEVKKAGNRDQVKVLAFDADPPTISGMEDGLVDVMVVQNPYLMGTMAIKLLKALLDEDQQAIQQILPKHGDPGGDLYDTGLKVVVPDSGSPLTGDVFESNTTFYSLSDFKRWLAEHHLQGS